MWRNRLILYLQMVASRMGAGSCPSCFTFHLASANGLGRQQRIAQVLDSIYPCGKLKGAHGF